MTSTPQPALEPFSGTEVGQDGIERTRDGRPVFKANDYDKITEHGAIRILNLFPAGRGEEEIHCELLPGTILDYKDRQKHKPPLRFIPFDALSWCWGSKAADSWINIRKEGTQYAMRIKSDLVAALHALRHHVHDRYLWVDAVCINQEKAEERNHQVEMMGDIYGKADCVRIWLGNSTDSSDLAIRFIKKEVLQLQHFDNLCESKEASTKWKALLEVMQRPWFSRRWVVQEVALARKAMIHCGLAKISWHKFAVAVELFVEVETATHRLSEVMKKDPKFYHIPMWFEYVSALGASLLVDATGKLFREYENDKKIAKTQKNLKRARNRRFPANQAEDSSYDSEDDELLSPADRAKQYESSHCDESLAPKGQPLLNLEYLVSNLSVFDTSVPHDTIYALLGISKDTTPIAARKRRYVTDHTQAILEKFTEKKQYFVDYEVSYVDACKEFIQFCVQQSLRNRIDESRALDVICRPWAAEENLWRKDDDDKPLLVPSWIPQLSRAAYGMDTKPGVEGKKIGRKNADPLVGLPTSLYQRNYNATENKSFDKSTFRFRKRITEKVLASEMGGRSAGAGAMDQASDPSTKRRKKSNTRRKKGNKKEKGDDHEQNKECHEATQEESHGKYQDHPAENTNAPVEPNREDNRALQNKFGKRKRDTEHDKTHLELQKMSEVHLNHFSMYVRGFVLDEIVEVQQSSQNGSIPSEWAQFAGWNRMEDDPPDNFWRTIVADRGRDGKNPPVYYSRACKESFIKGSYQSGTVDTTGLINNERNSVVAQFCRRVQAAIWNRALVKTKAGHFGLVAKNVQPGDLICILYGCSVPVVLRIHGPKDKTIIDAEMEWELKYLAAHVGTGYKKHMERTKVFRAKRANDMEEYKRWENQKREEWTNDADWAQKWPETQEIWLRLHQFNSWAMNEKAKGTRTEEDIKATHDFINVWFKTKKIPGEPEVVVKELWPNFEEDEEWQKKWVRDHSRGFYPYAFKLFNEWSRKHRKSAAGPNEWKNDLEKWGGKDSESWNSFWNNRWKKENRKDNQKGCQTDKLPEEFCSQILGIDSFRAWLRDSGKFCGQPEDVKNKQDWEADNGWRQRRPIQLSPRSEEEDRDFEDWMVENKRKIDMPSESNTVEVWSQFDAYIKEWRSRGENSSLDAAIGAWPNEKKCREEKERQRRFEAAKKQESEPFLERWRKDWAPPTVNWREFRLALAYGRRWKRATKRSKKLFLEKQGDVWSSRQSRQHRQAERAGMWEKRREHELRAIEEQEKRADGAPSEALDEFSGGHRGSQDEAGNHLDSTVNGFTKRSQTATETKRSKSPAKTKINPDASEVKDYVIHKAFTSPSFVDQLDHLLHAPVKKEDIKDRMKKREGILPSEAWQAYEAMINEKEKRWKAETPRLMGKDDKWEYDCGRKGRTGKRKTRDRLTDKQKIDYRTVINKKFEDSLGEDGRWYYEMCGECYVHGMMDGEAMAEQNHNGIPTKVFEIR